MPAKQETEQCDSVRPTYHTHLATHLPSLGSDCAGSEYLGAQVRQVTAPMSGGGLPTELTAATVL